ncbi:MAG: hypothetical protein ACI39H_02960 [Lachnospiraceae bacterium]
MPDWTDISNLVGNLANVFAVGIAAWSTKVAVQSQKQLREQENRNAMKGQILLWYNKIVLDDYLVRLNTFINHSNMVISNCRDVRANDFEKVLNDAYREINSDFRALKEHFFSLKLFSDRLYKDCDSSLQSINDVYSNVINKSLAKKRFCYYDLENIPKLQLKIISFLYDYGMDVEKRYDAS